MKTVTQWFDGDTKPVNIGPYQNGSENVYQFWNGKYWGGSSYTPESAEDEKDCESLYQNDKWRGLAVKPKSGISSK